MGANNAAAEAGKSENLNLDAAIIGTGVAGLYQLHLLRKQGLNVKAFDTASGVGRNVVLEPLSRSQIRFRKLYLSIPVR